MGNRGEGSAYALQLARLLGDCRDGSALRIEGSGRLGVSSVWHWPRGPSLVSKLEFLINLNCFPSVQFLILITK